MPFSVVFCGTPAFAVPSLRALAADSAFQVRAVITQPDKPVGRSHVPSAPPVKVAAQELGITVWQPEKLNNECNSESCPLAGMRPDFLVVVAYGQILNNAVLAIPKIAPINVHGSLLPRWRGASPIQHAILAGDTETGVTIQIMAEKLDAGPILAQSKTTIGEQETTETLYKRLSIMGAELLVKTLQQPLHPQEQSTTGITICRKLSRTDGVVDLQLMNALQVDRMIRALNPWPGVTVKIDGVTLKILGASLTEAPDSFALSCADNSTLWLTMVQPADKKPMSGGAWARGRHKQ